MVLMNLKSNLNSFIKKNFLETSLSEFWSTNKLFKRFDQIHSTNFNMTSKADPHTNFQWHIENDGSGVGTRKGIDLNVKSVWDDYNGKGVKVGVIDDGFAYNHEDLSKNYNKRDDFDIRDGDSDAADTDFFDSHGTMVMGVISAEKDNGKGGVGVAPGVDITGIRMGFGAKGSVDKELQAVNRMYKFDVVNNSWGYGGFFHDNFSGDFANHGKAVENAAILGRNGLGTITVFAAGNSGAEGQDTNYHSYQNSRFAITVGAIDWSGNITSFSTPGSSVLVSAPGKNIYTTDKPGFWGNSWGDYTFANGTSFAAPAVTGVVSLVLEANPNLGYRDVQEILAYSARLSSTSNKGWSDNNAINWNGGGLHFHHSYGFGLVDAHAAVRLAESWDSQKTWIDETELFSDALIKTPIKIIDNSQFTSSVNINSQGFEIDHVEVKINFEHDRVGDLIVTLTSPDGTESTLINRPGVWKNDKFGALEQNVSFTLQSNHFWGESGNGNWTLSVKDAQTGKTGQLNSWSLHLFGDSNADNNTYIYTNEYKKVFQADPARATVFDSGGTDTLNFAAVTDNLSISLISSTSSLIGSTNFFIGYGTVIERLIAGDGNDTLTGNNASNFISGGRGNDVISGGAGNDRLMGGQGEDILTGGSGQNTFVYKSFADQGDIIVDFKSGSSGDRIDFTQWKDSIKIDSMSQLKLNQSGNDTLLMVSTSGGESKKLLTLKNTKASKITKDSFVF